jgi:asparagine synthase (glutamine-hydrolysing)
MCGIFGYFGLHGGSLAATTVERMGQSIRYRGPDDMGTHFSEHAALGNNRLSIIDVAGGHQPFYSADRRIVVVQNGEIFNYQELALELERGGAVFRTKSDTEVILRLYEKEGIEGIGRLNGMFAISILDERSGEMFLARDRIGVKPLYFVEHDGLLLFASEIKALLVAGVKPIADLVALDQFLSFNYVPLPRTAFMGITHVMPGHYLRITRGGYSQVRWWDIAQIEPQFGCSESDWQEEFLATLDDAVRIRLRSDVPFGAFLSGGVDSSTIVGLMSRHVERPIKTFCIGFDDPRFDESRFALAAAQRFGTDHTSERVEVDIQSTWPKAMWHCDQPHGDASFMPTLRVSELAARHVKVVLTGDGGDELFAGYDKYRDFFGRAGVDTQSDEDFRREYTDNITLFGQQQKSALYRETFRRAVGTSDASKVIAPLFAAGSHFDRITQALYIDTMQLLPGNNLVKPDRMGMACSIEARTPFLDYRMVELAFRMPGSFKLQAGETKYLYKKAVAPLIGEELAYRRKQMFTVPIGEWFRKDLYPLCRELLVTQPTLVARLFDTSAVGSLLEGHRSGKVNYTREIRALLALEIWARAFCVTDAQT